MDDEGVYQPIAPNLCDHQLKPNASRQIFQHDDIGLDQQGRLGPASAAYVVETHQLRRREKLASIMC